VDARETVPFESAADLAARIPDTSLSAKFATGSSYFMVIATATRVSADSEEKTNNADSGSAKSDSVTSSDENPARQVKIKALLKRTWAEQEETASKPLTTTSKPLGASNKSLSVETAYWKMER